MAKGLLLPTVWLCDVGHYSEGPDSEPTLPLTRLLKPHIYIHTLRIGTSINILSVYKSKARGCGPASGFAGNSSWQAIYLINVLGRPALQSGWGVELKHIHTCMQIHTHTPTHTCVHTEIVAAHRRIATLGCLQREAEAGRLWIQISPPSFSVPMTVSELLQLLTTVSSFEEQQWRSRHPRVLERLRQWMVIGHQQV